IYYASKIICCSRKNQVYQTTDSIELNETTQFEISTTELINQNLKMILRKK
ncbi:riboflavin biosynthesis protein RibD, partial [Staphylococcus haemolyticus]